MKRSTLALITSICGHSVDVTAPQHSQLLNSEFNPLLSFSRIKADSLRFVFCDTNIIRELCLGLKYEELMVVSLLALFIVIVLIFGDVIASKPIATNELMITRTGGFSVRLATGDPFLAILISKTVTITIAISMNTISDNYGIR
ncbi:hypothetical protein AVEN_267334-1 [Araneus ventricosus]|uniref:Uncharacterized protein n=1 Tax=Araneus ventricosus TaxID=182803 RepID=A0A4Y2DLR9_ARAVE|nr:hypothetical protein AVEN_267334-1 [Araneus ventricosus]